MARAERFNALTHLAGALLTVAGFAVLVVPPLLRGDWLRSFGFAVYGVSLFLVYLASTLYHSAGPEARDLYRCCDRIAIYLLIAGTYTPLALLKLPPSWGWPLLGTAWLLAAGGAIIELVRPREKETPSVALYLLMGWICVVAIEPLMTSLTVMGAAWLGAGGVLFTIGALNLRFELVPRSHEIWHVLVLAGSACHFATMLFYVS